jgi:hypothetical protein
MSISMIELTIEKAVNVSFSEDTITVDLNDGRTISVPINWYPRLYYSTISERNNWRFIGEGEGIHWDDLDEDISIRNLILGQPSGESNKSLNQWLDKRKQSSS